MAGAVWFLMVPRGKVTGDTAGVIFLWEKSTEKETVIKVLPRQLQGECPADRRKKEEPADNQDDDCYDYRMDRNLGCILIHTMTS
jgi:hypothetical protein